MAYEPSDDSNDKPAKVPEGYDSIEAFLKDVREEFDKDVDYDKENREAAISDSEFMVGKQWPEEIETRRQKEGKPTLVYNRLVAFVAQILGNRRLNETVIKVLPDNGGQKAVATVREGLIRNIQKVSNADIAYNKAHENQVICGIGNFQVELRYAEGDVFDQDIVISSVPNPLAVVWDRMSLEPTGRDARHCYVVDTIPKDVYEKQFKGKSVSDLSADSRLLGDLVENGWFDDDGVRIMAYWKMKTRVRTLAMLRDGSVEDITDRELTEPKPGPNGEPLTLADWIMQREDGTPIMRDAETPYACMYLLSGADILAGPYELPIDRVPVFRVPGWEVNVGEKKHRWGLVRFLKDPVRLHNFWRSVIAEKLMLSPKAPWIAPDTAVQGRENEWRNSHRSDDNLLIYSGESGVAPKRADPVQMEPALIQEAGTAVQDIRDISNLHEASLGIQSNEVSGKAIIARQRVGELGTIIYQDNLNLAISECGRVINQLIPFVYDAPRVVKIIGPDGKDALVKINDKNDPESADITLGKYAVSVTTGPSYTTRRIEAQESMMALFNANPQAFAVAADVLVEAFDWPEAEEIARRLRLGLPDGILPQDDMTDEQKAQAEQTRAAQQKQAAIAERMALAEAAAKEAEADEKRASADLKRAQADKAIAEASVVPVKADSEIRSRTLNDALATIETADGGESDR